MFNVDDHIAKISDKKIEAIVRPAFNFFESTPYYQLDNLPNFKGAGVYALFLKSTEGTCYAGNLPPLHPIYIGKAVPKGSRQGKKNTVGSVLKSRLNKHLKSINEAENLYASNFVCRFMILQGQSTDMISAMESYFIRQYNPLWNTYIDGFGINAPGKGRYNQSPSEWDTLHPGRYYAKQLTGKPRDMNQIMDKISNYLRT
ncbi:Uncharacterised protein [BD1-7 clade bacterium]|uniref:Eco29kI restriction endonuclease n=1 Tax=BD1-7 clade bacterium TaxID=2029982 RepID=A0A5S9PB82_9GAMM|nr:Uncharacterised protein [BD1-7 clade bacterium]CAA0101699.1 Uncharacterised protein [BD1-7 clade bacterium]